VNSNPALTYAGTSHLWASSVNNLPFGHQGDVVFSKTSNATYLGGNGLLGTDIFNGQVTLVAPPAGGASYVDVTLSDGGSGESTLQFEMIPDNQVPDGASLALMVPGLLSLGAALRLRRRATTQT